MDSLIVKIEIFEQLFEVRNSKGDRLAVPAEDLSGQCVGCYVWTSHGYSFCPFRDYVFEEKAEYRESSILGSDGKIERIIIEKI